VALRHARKTPLGIVVSINEEKQNSHVRMSGRSEVPIKILTPSGK
jgi:hypothetical protein